MLKIEPSEITSFFYNNFSHFGGGGDVPCSHILVAPMQLGSMKFSSHNENDFNQINLINKAAIFFNRLVVIYPEPLRPRFPKILEKGGLTANTGKIKCSVGGFFLNSCEILLFQ